MGFISLFKKSNYFNKKINPKCDYCQHGKRTREGNKVLCEKSGMVELNYSCGKFIYSPLKRIPVKQLNFVGSLADEDLYLESAGDRAEKEKESKKEETSVIVADPDLSDDDPSDGTDSESVEEESEE